MEFQLLLNQALSKNSEYKQLEQKLKDKQSRCLKNIDNQQQKNQCMSKRIHFESYYQQYFDQFKEKGRNMCSKVMSEHRDLETKIKQKDQCIEFYAKSIPLFEGNVIDKLKSLVKNTDFSQL